MSVTKAGTNAVHHVRRGDPEAGPDVLLPHTDPKWDREDWFRDGVTCEPALQCMALTAKGVRCPKEANVSLTWVEPERPIRLRPLDVCGAHFNQHRRGNEVRLW